jgi:putative intracellular protease/amidase
MDLRKGRWPSLYFPLLCLGIIFLSSCANPKLSDPRSEAQPATSQLSNNSKSLTATPTSSDASPRILLVTGDGFESWHYLEIRNYFDKAGYEIALGSHTLDTIESKILSDPEEASDLQADLLISDVDIFDYEAVVLINDWAGFMTGEYPEVYDLVRKAHDEDRLLAAYDFTPMILGEAGLLEGVQATSHISAHDSCQSLERSYGAICTSALVEVDGNIITADGYHCPASWFAEQVDQAIKGKIQPAGSG